MDEKPKLPWSQSQCSKHSFSAGKDRAATLREARAVGPGVSAGLGQRLGTRAALPSDTADLPLLSRYQGNRLES